jgi:hypothetical protein
MTDPADNPLPVPNSEQEYLNGVADNGDPLTIVSEHLIPPRDADEAPPPIGAAAAAAPKSRFHIEADRKILAAQRAHIERVRKCVELHERTIALGEPAQKLLALEAEIALVDRERELEIKRRSLEQLKAAPETGALASSRLKPGASRPRQDHDADATPEADSGLDAGDESGANAADSSAAEPGGPNNETIRSRTSRAGGTPSRRAAGTAALPAPRGPRVREPRAPKFSPALLLTLALRAAKDLPKLSALLCELESKLSPAEAELKLKEEFYLDKGVSLSMDTLCSMDEGFGKLGFGNWMPFRFLDQRLMFCGILNRVMAAHGLIPSGNAAVYRKLLEDTPSISPKAADAGPPKSWGLGYRVREHRHFQTMLARIAENRAGRGPPL